MRECALVAVGLEAGSSDPVMLLQEVDEPRRVLPIWIGLPEAEALERHRLPLPRGRRTTHSLLVDLVTGFGRRLERMHITEIDGTVFVGELVFDGGLTVSARPSDAVVLAVHLEVPLLVADAVLDEAGVDAEQVQGVGAGSTTDDAAADVDVPDPQDVEREISEFRRILDDVDPEDFDKDR